MTQVAYRTNPQSLAVHLIYLDDGAAVCGRRLLTVPDEGGAVCERCLKVAKTQGLRLPDRDDKAIT